MELRPQEVAGVLMGALVILFAFRRRARATSKAKRRGPVSKAIDSAEHAHSVWLFIQATVILVAVVGLAFFNDFVADILSATLILMVAVWLWAQRDRESGTPHDRDAP